MTNSVDPDQAAPIWSTLFASILEFVSHVRQLFAADDFSRRNFSDAFFLGALRVKTLFSCLKLNEGYGQPVNIRLPEHKV